MLKNLESKTPCWTPVLSEPKFTVSVVGGRFLEIQHHLLVIPKCCSGQRLQEFEEA